MCDYSDILVSWIVTNDFDKPIIMKNIEKSISVFFLFLTENINRCF